MKLQICIFVILLINGCQFKKNSLKDYQDIQTLFSSEEINDLEKILKFFDQSVCESENLSKKRLKNCYNLYFKKMKDTEKTTGDIDIQIPYEKQKRILYSLNSNTFDQIWHINKVNNRGLDTLEMLSFNKQGKFVMLLKKIGNINSKIKHYYERFEMIGDISPTMTADMLINYTDYDISDKRIRLVLAIHYLTLNQQFNANKKLNIKHHQK